MIVLFAVILIIHPTKLRQKLENIKKINFQLKRNKY